jgi:hypothetical protein
LSDEPELSAAEFALAWVESLKAMLVEEHVQYAKLTDPAKQRDKASLIVGKVAMMLVIHPIIGKQRVLALRDISQFFADLSHGRKHPWSIPVNVGGTNIMLSSRKELKGWVRGVFHLLVKNGYRTKEAYVEIASGLTKYGRTSRGGRPFRWQLVQQWCREVVEHKDEPLVRRVQAIWDAWAEGIFAETKNDGLSEYLERKILAASIAEYVWTIPELRDGFISGESE